MIASLQELDAIGEYFVDQAIGLVNTPRPHAASEVFQMSRLADPVMWVP